MINNIKRKRLFAVSAVVLGLLAATGATLAANLWNASAPRSLAISPVDAPKTAVTATLVKVVNIDDLLRPTSTLTFTSRIVGRYDSPLAFRVPGKISARHIEVGQRIQKGDLLFELEPDDFDLQLATSVANEKAADAAVLQAEQEERRLSQLLRERAISQSEYDSVRLLLDSSQAKKVAAAKQTELARRQLEYTKLHALADAVVVSIRREVGEVVSAGQEVVKVVQSDELEIEVDLPEQFASMRGIEYGQVSFWTHPEELLMVRLRELSPIADSASRTFRARYSFVDPLERPQRDSDSWAIKGIPFKLGMTANIAFGESSKENLVAIPAAAIAYDNDHASVWAILNHEDSETTNIYSVEQISVLVKQLDKDMALVPVDALQGRSIVAAGVHKLNRDAVVRIWTK